MPYLTKNAFPETTHKIVKNTQISLKVKCQAHISLISNHF